MKMIKRANIQTDLRSSLDAVRLAAEQTLYRLMNNRLGTLWLRNPGSEGIADHSTECLMPQDMIQVRGIHRAIWGLITES